MKPETPSKLPGDITPSVGYTPPDSEITILHRNGVSTSPEPSTGHKTSAEEILEKIMKLPVGEEVMEDILENISDVDKDIVVL